MRPKRWANYAEVIQPGTRFSTDLVVDADLLERMVDRFGEPWKARAVFGEDRSEAGIRDAIREALRSFRDAVVAEDRQLTGEFAAVESFYEGLDDDATHLRIGFGTGYHSNTVATALSAADRASVRLNCLDKQMIHDGCGGNLTTDREEGMLFCHECDSTLDPRSDEVRPPFPKTRRFVHRNGSPAEPLGWLQVEF